MQVSRSPFASWAFSLKTTTRSRCQLEGHVISLSSFIPHMISRGRGSIASTSSVSALTGGGFCGPHYSAAKAGMLGLTKDMARELAPKAFG